jgi:hypothetical protein
MRQQNSLIRTKSHCHILSLDVFLIDVSPLKTRLSTSLLINNTARTIMLVADDLRLCSGRRAVVLVIVVPPWKEVVLRGGEKSASLRRYLLLMVCDLLLALSQKRGRNVTCVEVV